MINRSYIIPVRCGYRYPACLFDRLISINGVSETTGAKGHGHVTSESLAIRGYKLKNNNFENKTLLEQLTFYSNGVLFSKIIQVAYAQLPMTAHGRRNGHDETANRLYRTRI